MFILSGSRFWTLVSSSDVCPEMLDPRTCQQVVCKVQVMFFSLWLNVFRKPGEGGSFTSLVPSPLMP